MDLDIFSDPICPWCFIGKKRLEEALEQRPDVQPNIRWRTFQLNPQMPSQGMDRRDYLETKFGGPENADRVYNNIGRAGLSVGIDFRFDLISVTPNTQKAHRLIHHAQQTDHDQTGSLLKSMFEGYFLKGLDIGDDAVLADLAAEAGLGIAETLNFLQGDTLLQEVLEEDRTARRMGISGVPCFILGGQFALSGAQEADAFFPLFDLLQERERNDKFSD